MTVAKAPPVGRDDWLALWHLACEKLASLRGIRIRYERDGLVEPEWLPRRIAEVERLVALTHGRGNPG